jgi:Leucine-rich repeat (LRR) protein
MSTQPRLPYLGLRPFEEADEILFFGREVQVNAALRQLEDHAFLAVVGSSGSGKSSFVRAGLLPAVRQGFLLGTSNWLVVVIRPGYEPFHQLARELDYALRSRSTVTAETDPERAEAGILAALRRSDRGLLLALDEKQFSVGTLLLVVVDQFEELFAFRRLNAETNRTATRDEAAAFVRMLLRSCTQPDTRVKVVLTMRSDFIGDSEAFLGLPEAISRSQFLVPRLDRTQMREIITHPGKVKNAAFRPFTVDENLVTRIINEAGDQPDQLPLMEHALMRTWKIAVQRAGSGTEPIRLTLEDFADAGGLANALSLHADAAWDQIKEDPRLANLVRQLFLLLCDVTPDGQIIRRRPRVSEVEATAEASLDEITTVIQLFQDDDRNFLLPTVATRLTSDVTLDISHESLIRHWKRFNEWLTDEMDSVRTFQMLRERALRWPRQEPVLQDPALTVALKWLEQRSPTAAWAKRWGGGLDRVLEYMEESRETHRRELKAIEAERREKLAQVQRHAAEQAENAKRFRRAAIGLALVSLVACMAAIYTIYLLYNLRSTTKSLAALQGQKTILDGAIGSLKSTRDDLQKSNVALAGIAAAHGIVTPLDSGSVAVAFLESDSSPDGTIPLLKQVGRVKSLSFSHTKVTDSALSEVSQLPYLTSLDLSFTGVTDVGVARIAKMSHLQELVLNDSMITEKSLPLLAELTNLESLEISRTQVSKAGVNQLRQLLKGVSITYNPDPLLEALAEYKGHWAKAIDKADGETDKDSIEFSQSKLTDAGLKRLNSYREITLDSCDDISNDGLTYLKQNKLLTKLSIKDMEQIGDQGIENLVGISTLRELNLEDMPITNRSMKAISQMSGLTHLKISSVDAKIDDSGVAQLKTLSSLRDVELDWLELTDESLKTFSALQNVTILSLRDSISCKKCRTLAQLSNLTSLNLDNNQEFSDANSEYLEKLGRLRSLSLIETDITASGIVRLRKALPKATIEWSPYVSVLAGSNEQLATEQYRGLADIFADDEKAASLTKMPTGDRILSVGPVSKDHLTAEVSGILGHPAQAWSLTGCRGQEVEISMSSRDFDGLIIIVGEDLPIPLSQFAREGSKKGNFGASLVLTCTRPPYKVIVGSLDNRIGAFELGAGPVGTFSDFKDFPER